MEYVNVSDICNITTGTKDVNEGNLNGEYPFFTCASEPLKSDTYSFDGPSILLPGNGANVGLVDYYEGKFEAYQRTYVLKNFKNYIPKFIYYYFKKYWKNSIKDVQYGSATNYIRYKNIANFKIPQFGINHQQDLVCILDRITNLLKARESSIQLNKQFLNSIFYKMFGDLNWKYDDIKYLRIGDVIKPILNEKTTSNPNKVYTYIDISSLDNHEKHINSTKSYTGLDAPSRAKQLAKQGDILVSTVRPNLNGVAMIENEYDNLIVSTGFCVLRPNEKIILTEYLFTIVKSRYFISELSKIARGASYPAVSDKDIKNLIIPIPSIELQIKYQLISLNIKLLIQNYNQSLNEIDKLYNSVMQKAFKGELVQ